MPGKLGRGRPEPGRMPRDDGIADTGAVAPARGAVCARDSPRLDDGQPSDVNLVVNPDGRADRRLLLRHLDRGTTPAAFAA
jgi:hypothetical protein